MSVYFPTVAYGSRRVNQAAGLAALRSMRRRHRRMLGQDAVGDLPFTGTVPVDIFSPGPVAIAPAGSIEPTPYVPPSSVDPSSYYAALGVPTVGGVPAITAVGTGPQSGVTYTSRPSAPASSMATSAASWFSAKNSVLGISNGVLVGGAAAIALLAAIAGGRK